MPGASTAASLISVLRGGSRLPGLPHTAPPPHMQRLRAPLGALFPRRGVWARGLVPVGVALSFQAPGAAGADVLSERAGSDR